MSVELTYVVERTCPVCQANFHVTKVRSKLRMIKQENDFNILYEQINPLYYAVWLCPHCGYAAQDTVFEEILETTVKKLKKFLDTCEVAIDFPDIRSREQAILLYKVAIYQAEFVEAKNSRIAGLYLRLAWLYREAEDEVMEKLAMRKALSYYEVASYKENYPIGNMSEVTMDYLISQLQYRLGEIDKAAAGFSRLISNPKVKNEKRIADMARDTWEDIKAIRKESEEAQA